MKLNNNQNMLDADYMAYLGSISTHETHAGYFSIDKKGRSVNSDIKHGSDQPDDISAYDLILKNKEQKNKIACAEKLFEQLSSSEVKYGKIDNYDTLMSLVK